VKLNTFGCLWSRNECLEVLLFLHVIFCARKVTPYQTTMTRSKCIGTGFKRNELSKIIALGLWEMTRFSKMKIIKNEPRNFLFTLVFAGCNQWLYLHKRGLDNLLRHTLRLQYYTTQVWPRCVTNTQRQRKYRQSQQSSFEIDKILRWDIPVVWNQNYKNGISTVKTQLYLLAMSGWIT